MKAFVSDKYGSYEVLKKIEILKPTPKKGEVLVKVLVTTINSADVELLKGNFLIRLGSPFKPAHKVLGSDISGIVEMVGPEVEDFVIDDLVYADTSDVKFGGFAEYICVSQQDLRKKPKSLSILNAGAIPSAAVLAYQGIKDMKLNANDKVLINGAGGGMGTFAIQIAKAYGTEVTGVDNKYKQEKMLSLGADYVLDYELDDFTEQNIKYDAVLDCYATRKMKKIKKVLREDSCYVLVGGKVRIILQAFLESRRKNTAVSVLLAKYNNKEYLNHIQDLINDDKLYPVIDKIYKFSELKKAFAYYRDNKFFGKIAIVNDEYYESIKNSI